MKTLTAHPYADLFPMIEGEARASFTENIRANGVLAPVVLLDGRILDGRNRYRAAQELGIECPTVEFAGTDPLAFVIAANLERRHLSTAQRAAIGAEMANMQHGTNQHTTKVEGSNDPSSSAVTIKQAARLMSVSEKSVKRAKALMRTDPEAHERVKRGEDRPVKKPKAPEAAKAPKSLGWITAVAEHRGGLPAGWSSNTLRMQRDQPGFVSKQQRLEAQLGWEIPKLLSADDPRIEQISRAIDLVRAEETPEAVEAERAENERLTLSLRDEMDDADRKRFDAALATAARSLRAEADLMIKKNEKSVAKLIDYYRSKIKQAEEAETRYIKLQGDVSGLLTETEFKSLKSFCHPDRHRNCGMDERANAAFQLCDRLERGVNRKLGAAAMRERGWAAK